MAGNISFLGHPLLLGNVGWWGNHIMENISLAVCQSLAINMLLSLSLLVPLRGRFFYLGHSFCCFEFGVLRVISRGSFSLIGHARPGDAGKLWCCLLLGKMLNLILHSTSLWRFCGIGYWTPLWAELAVTVIWQWSVYALPLSVGDRS